MVKNISIILVLLAVAVGVYLVMGNNQEMTLRQAQDSAQNIGKAAVVETNHGVFKISFYENDAPKTAENFIKLAGQGYYNGLIFHRIISGFMMQGGDPICAVNSKDDKGMCGTGGPGYQFADELNPQTASYKTGYKKGVVAMANAGPNTNGSQFFVMLSDYPLPNNYTIFGKVVEGQEVVDRIGKVKTNANDRPLEAVVIQKVVVE